MVCCVFCCSTRFHTLLHVLNYWSYVFFLFLALLANGFARQVTHLKTSSQRRENAEPWEKDDLQSLFDIIYYFNHTQLQTEITSQHQTEAQITF